MRIVFVYNKHRKHGKVYKTIYLMVAFYSVLNFQHNVTQYTTPTENTSSRRETLYTKNVHKTTARKIRL